MKLYSITPKGKKTVQWCALQMDLHGLLNSPLAIVQVFSFVLGRKPTSGRFRKINHIFYTERSDGGRGSISVVAPKSISSICLMSEFMLLNISAFIRARIEAQGSGCIFPYPEKGEQDIGLCLGIYLQRLYWYVYKTYLILHAVLLISSCNPSLFCF